jgi:OOP family OmpA-OmpF porin
MKSKLFYSQLFGLLLILILILLVVPKYSKIIPNELKQRIEKRLEKENLSWVSVRVEHRDVTLSGLAPTFEENKQAVWLTKTLKGVRSVENKISPMLISPYNMKISYDGENIRLKGYMPSKERKSKLLIEVSNFYGRNIVDEIDIGAGEPKAWDAFILTVAKEMQKFDLSLVTISDNVLHVSGKIGTEEARMAVEKSLSSFKEKGFNIHCHMVALDASARVCQEKFNILLGKEKIEFESSKSFIKASNHKLLEELSDISLLCPSVKIEIIGHTDSLGNDNKNKDLSLSRAKAVVAKLFGFGIPLERLTAKGMGEKSPVSSNETDDGRAKNRRIEFKVIEAKGK